LFGRGRPFLPPLRFGLLTTAIEALRPTSTVRNAARWLLREGAEVGILHHGRETVVKSEADLPDSDLQIVGLHFDRWKSSPPDPPPPEKEFRVLQAVTALRHVYLRLPGITDASLSFLAGNPDLRSLSVLTQAGAVLNGPQDLTFTLHDAAIGGRTVGAPNVANSLVVADGLFGVTLDFGPGAFDGSSRWLQIAVRPGGSATAPTELSPRTPITSLGYPIGWEGLHTRSPHANGLQIIQGAGSARLHLRTDQGTTNVAQDFIIANEANQIHFQWLGAGLANRLSAMTIATDGNVGVGTGNPTTRLDVAGVVKASGTHPAWSWPSMRTGPENCVSAAGPTTPRWRAS